MLIMDQQFTSNFSCLSFKLVYSNAFNFSETATQIIYATNHHCYQVCHVANLKTTECCNLIDDELYACLLRGRVV